MGAGRTEFAMSLFGREYGQKISGEVYMHGKQVKISSVKDAIENKIAYTSEDRKTYGLILINDIKWNMTLAALRGFFSTGLNTFQFLTSRTTPPIGQSVLSG